MAGLIADHRPPDLAYKDKVDVRLIFFNQVERCLMAAGTEFFRETVEALAQLLPTASHINVMNRREEWSPVVEHFEWEYGGPIALGSIADPMMHKIKPRDNKKYSWYLNQGDYPIPYLKSEEGTDKLDERGEPTIDWDSPHIRSPHKVKVEAPDYLTMFRVIIEEAEAIKIMWDESGGGVVNLLKSVAEIQKTSKKAPRTPVYKSRRPRTR